MNLFLLKNVSASFFCLYISTGSGDFLPVFYKNLYFLAKIYSNNIELYKQKYLPDVPGKEEHRAGT